MNAYGITDAGCVRQQNQDAFAVKKLEGSRMLCVVCDGMGGARSGDIASELAVSVFIDELSRRLEGETASYEAVLKSAAELANEAIFMKACQDSDCLGMGTTLVAALISGKEAYLINIGDSRAYHISQGRITQITRDHSLVADMIMRGDITAQEARIHPGKNLITRAVGTETDVESDFFVEKLASGDIILLCSDGLTNVLTDEEILDKLYEASAADEACRLLLKLAKARGAPDNVTAVIVEID